MASTNYLIKILPGEGCNPEFAPDAEDQEGHEFSGYVLMGFNDGEMRMVYTSGITIQDIATGIADNRNAGSVACLRAAFASAEGRIRGAEIMHEQEENDIKEGFLQLIKGGMPDDETGD